MIIKKEKELFKSTFPVVLISSSELANIFPHFYQYFDTLIIDESTRSSFENNITNFLKSKQIIISGDEQQMPPNTLYKNDQTDIFSSQSQTYDSVFQFAEEHQFKAINLNYHYRSKHRDLFRFSNKAFYHNLINLLPNRKTEAISFFQVDGMFHEHLNKRETEKIIDWLSNLEYSKQSIGIYTLNLKQKEFIESAISEKVDKNEVFRNKYYNWIKNGFSVMNLENIQGEEKDIVILSLCYGNTIKHQFTANFGFLSSYQGYKYLNVLITRAKEQLVIFNSIRANFYQKWPKEINYNHKMFFAFIDYAQACSSKDENKVQNILDHVNTIDQSKPAIRFEQKHNYISERIKQVLINDFNISSNIKINSYLGDFAIDILVPELKLIILNDLDKNPINNFITDLYKKEQLASFGYHVIYTWSPMWFQNEQFAIEQLKKKLADFIKS
jgi:superfamily I DNA and/or RNA helicase